MRYTRLFSISLLTAIVIAASAAPAHSIGLFAQWQDAKDMGSGFGFGLKENFQIIPIFSVEARASWLQYDGDGNYPDLDMFPLEAVARAKLGLLYGGVGVGYYIATGDDSPDSGVGWSALAGAEFELFGLGAFAEARYLVLEPDEDDSIGGMRNMNGFGANVGVILPFF